MRFRQRHTHMTAFAYLNQTLVSNGWKTNPDSPQTPLNFNLESVELIDGWVQEPEGLSPEAITVVFSEGDENDYLEEELGGMQSVEYTYFIDVAAPEAWIADSIVSDLKDAFSSKTLTIIDYTNGSGTPSEEKVEFTDLEINRESQFDRRAWRTIAMTGTAFFV